MTRVLYLLFILSGAAGLIYESIWTRYLGLFVGHDAYAQIIVLVIFLGGMSAGAMVVSRYSERLREPLQGYAYIEFAVGCIGLVFHELFQWTTGLAYGTLYPALAGSSLLTVFKWGLAGALILPQSVLLGATFPLMSAGVLRLRREREGRNLSMLYFANSLGAAVGVLLAGFYLVGLAGLPGTLLIAAILNLGVGLVTYGVVVRARRTGAGQAAADTAASAGSRAGPSVRLEPDTLRRLLLFTSFGTAVASFIYEVDWIRMLSLVVGSATHAFELMLSAFILGLALGAYWIGSRIDRLRNPLRTLGVIQWTMGLMALATLPVYVASFQWTASLLATFARNDLGYVGFTIARYAICLLVMLPATFCAGMTLPLITRTLIRAGQGERAIGGVYAWNTLGSIVGVALGGLVLLPLIGVKVMLVVGATIDMAIGVLLVLSGERRATSRGLGYALGFGAAAAALLVAFRVQLGQQLLASGVYRHGVLTQANEWEMLFYRDGRTATVASFRVRSTGHIALSTNGKPDASLNQRWFRGCDSVGVRAPLTSDAATQALTPLITLAHIPTARNAAIIGYGSGMTSHVLLGSESLREVVTIEIEPEMVEGARNFYPANRRVYDDPRSRLVIDDAKSYFASEHRRFDIILSEPSNPWVSGVSGLFTTEFYARLREYLTEDGVLGQWIHTYELDDGLVLSVLAAIHQNFRSYQVFVVAGGDLLVVASKRAQLPAPDWAVFQATGAREDLCRFHPLTPAAIEDLRLVSRWELDPILAGTQQANSDFYPVLDLGAERRRYIRSAAVGFRALSADWYNLLASVKGVRQGPGEDTLAALPESPRVRARAFAARLRLADGGGGAGHEVQQAAFVDQQWHASLSQERAPHSWQMWLNQMDQVGRFRHGGQAGIPDEEFYGAARRYAARMGAPEAVQQVLAFRHAIAGWKFPDAAAAADRIIPVALVERRLIAADELRDGAVMAKLHVGDVAGARQVLDTLARFTVRGTGDLRTRLLEAYVTTAEQRRAAALR